MLIEFERPEAKSHKPTFADSFSLTSIAGYTMSGIGDITIG